MGGLTNSQQFNEDSGEGSSPRIQARRQRRRFAPIQGVPYRRDDFIDAYASIPIAVERRALLHGSCAECNVDSHDEIADAHAVIGVAVADAGRQEGATSESGSASA